MKSRNEKINWAFFGSSNFSVIVLNELETLGLVPDLIVTTPDKPKGRGLKVESGPVKAWAEEREIPVFAPASLKAPETVEEIKNLGPWDVFLVASYGKIVTPDIFNMPKHETLNIHPSLLPKLRGPSPIEGAILSEKETGVTIMKIDAEVDHGPIVSQKSVFLTEWPPYYGDLELILAKEGADLFADTVTKWINGEIKAQDQFHSAATFTKKFSKDDLWITLDDNAEKNLRKIRAFSGNRGVYFFVKQNEREIRVIVTKASIKDDLLEIEKVKPEGKKEMSYADFERGLKN